MELTLQQILGQNQFLRQRMLAVQSVLNSLRTDDNSIGGLDLNMSIPFPRAAIIWLFGAIVPRGAISQDAMMVVIQMFGPQLLAVGEIWEKELETEQRFLTPLVLAIADRKLVSLTGVDGCYDLQRCQQLNEVPVAFEGISYNLSVPVRLEWLRIRREARDGTDAQTQNRVIGRHNPGDGAAGARGRPARQRRSAMGPDHHQDGARRAFRDQSISGVFEQAYGRHRTGDDG